MTFNHGAPVEALLSIGGGSVLLSAGGNFIKVWDTIAGRMIHSFSNHQKTITGLCLDSTKTRLLSGSLDGHIKIYNIENYNVVHGLKYNQPILSLAMAPDNSRLVVGMADGSINIRQ